MTLVGETLGDFIFLPLHLPLLGIEQLIELSEETNIFAKAADLMKSDDGRREISPTFSPRTGFGACFKYRPWDNRKKTLSLRATIGFDEIQKYELRLQDFRLNNKTYFDGRDAVKLLS